MECEKKQKFNHVRFKLQAPLSSVRLSKAALVVIDELMLVMMLPPLAASTQI